uniref:Uncharacterized protein n=1 Tax=Siphoviridae sp. ctHjK2 TaxID=2827831 RepID=A0A8S5SRV3_9CAUD|nr:MAG TPA: hypothetical protein [Siphoviridae sp. ctHjK2]
MGSCELVQNGSLSIRFSFLLKMVVHFYYSILAPFRGCFFWFPRLEKSSFFRERIVSWNLRDKECLLALLF